MAVREKPKSSSKTTLTESKALEFISKGGTVAGEEPSKGSQPVNVKIPIEMLERIDKAVQKRKVPIYRVQWILEAIVEKLEREEV